MDIIKKTSTTNTTSSKGRKIKYIVEHYTAGVTSKKGSARNTASWFSQAKAKASADFIVDDAEIVQFNPDPANRYCWSVGGKKYNNKGGRLYGTVNSGNSISIEICSNTTDRKVHDANTNYWYFTDATLNNAVELTKYLMQKYNIDANHVIRHYDVNGKPCPGIIGWNADSGDESKWRAFHARIGGGGSVSANYVNSTDSTNLKKGNRGDAVKIMQTMLIAVGYSCGNSGADGDFGNNTLIALKAFQKDNGLTVDGIYGTKSKTALESIYNKMKTNEPTITPSPQQNKLQASALKNLSNADVIKTVGPLFTEDQKQTGILASISLAQFILESGYGKSGLTQNANNGFGMKANLSSNSWASAWDGTVYKTQTKEQKTDGTIYTITAEFRKYPSLSDSIADHSAYLNGAKKGNNLRYAGLKGCMDYRKAAQIIKDGGYATSLSYVNSLCSLIEKWNLTQYDINSSTVVNQASNQTVETVGILKKGDSGESVRVLQTMLIACNYDCGKAGVDGDFGNNTKTALKNFQKHHGLAIDGVYGEKSKEKLTMVYELLSNQSFDESAVKTFTTTTKLNLREGPGMNYLVITAMPRNKKVICRGYHTNEWYCVIYENIVGFCNKKYLK